MPTPGLTDLDAGLPPPANAGIFGATVAPETAQIVLIPVPWEATTSYGKGTATGPKAILRASHQLDLFDPSFGDTYAAGITMLAPDARFALLSAGAGQRALAVNDAYASGEAPKPEDLMQVNKASHAVNALVHEAAKHWLNAGKIVGVVGGDHSSPFGLIQALAEVHGKDGFDVLHIDAHHDLRVAYQGFVDSHASIMYNVLERLPAVRRLVQVGIRDFSRGEYDYSHAQGERTQVYYDHEIATAKADGRGFACVVKDICASLGPKVYISFDIDGLDPALCPSTGTPVPGGLSFQEAMLILERVVESGAEVVGFDLCEVAPSSRGDEWDANVGARVLYKLCGAAVASAKRQRL